MIWDSILILKASVKKVYEPLLDIFVGQNPSNPYKIEYKVHPLNELGNPAHILIPAEELRYLDRGIDHLRNYKAYQGVYRAWEEALIQSTDTMTSMKN